MYILRFNLDQLRKMQLQGLRLGIEPAPSELSCVRTVLQYCCYLIAILTASETFLKISHWKGSTRVGNDRDVICLPEHDVMVIIFATFKMSYYETKIKFVLFEKSLKMTK